MSSFYCPCLTNGLWMNLLDGNHKKLDARVCVRSLFNGYFPCWHKLGNSRGFDKHSLAWMPALECFLQLDDLPPFILTTLQSLLGAFCLWHQWSHQDTCKTTYLTCMHVCLSDCVHCNYMSQSWCSLHVISWSTNCPVGMCFQKCMEGKTLSKG